MLNSIEIYQDCARKVARAVHRDKDYARATFEMRWYNEAVRKETGEDARIAESAHQEAYKREVQCHSGQDYTRYIRR